MTNEKKKLAQEPVLAVGLLENVVSLRIRLEGSYTDSRGASFSASSLFVEAGPGVLRVDSGSGVFETDGLELHPVDPDQAWFSLQVKIGIDFHWQQHETQKFSGSIRILVKPNATLMLINLVPLETYLTSVVCSEMNADSPLELIRAHAIISRSWLLSQLANKTSRPESGNPIAPISRADRQAFWVTWTDQKAHADFDVCGDDHCQRYQGVSRIQPRVQRGVASTRGVVLKVKDEICDARFSKCCGGVTEDFRAAWGDTKVSYLLPVVDGPEPGLPHPPLSEEGAFEEFLKTPKPAYCNCLDLGFLKKVLNSYDLQTSNFFRWQVPLDAQQAATWIRQKSGVDLGPLIAIEPEKRGLSGRLIQVRLVGQKGEMILGKELQIRRLLSSSHLYSSAFVAKPMGNSSRPEGFLLSGAGWGHGVGLCQIGAAVMASQGLDHEQILKHYYHGVRLVLLYD